MTGSGAPRRQASGRDHGALHPGNPAVAQRVEDELAQFLNLARPDGMELGAAVGGERLVDENTKGEMDKMLKEIQDGTFATKWIAENRQNNRVNFLEERQHERGHMIEQVGAELRDMMPFIKPKKLEDYDPR